MVPTSAALRISRVPPIASVRARATTRPRPAPGSAEHSAPSRSNGVNSRLIISAGIPRPESRTATVTVDAPESFAPTSTQPPAQL